MIAKTAGTAGTGGKRTGGRKLSLRNHIMLTTALTLPAALLGYGNRAAYGGACVLGGGVYTCTGAANAATDMTQTLNAAAVTVTTQPGFGIDTTTNGGDAFDLNATTSLTFTDNNASDITGAADGIDASNTGTGTTSITTSGAVTGTTGRGIGAFNTNAASAGLSITATGAVAGGTDGIYAFQFGPGMLTVNVGSVTGTTGRGIQTQASNGTSTGQSVTATGAVIGGTDGIYARHSGPSMLTVNAASVTGNMSRGLSARTTNTNSTGLSVTATGAVIGATDGIYARHAGSTGMVTVNAASVTGNSRRGLTAQTQDANSTGLSITATGAVVGSTDGIYARHAGTGMLTVNAASATGNTRRGIDAYNTNAASTGLSITATGAVTGGTDGIYVQHAGTGTLTVNAASVTGTTERGILAITLIANSTGLSVTATGAVTGGTYGIDARHVGTGMLTVNATSVTGTGNRGIFAQASNAASTSLSITTTGTVTGGTDGIYVQHAGTGMVSVNAAAVTGTTGRGIFARTFNSNSSGLSVTATGAVTGGNDGILAFHAGTGMVSVNAASVTGTTGRGIFAQSDAVSTGLSVTATGAVTGSIGIVASHLGSGAASVTTSGTVTGTGSRGIYARAFSFASTGTTVTATGAVTGATDGIFVQHSGTDMLTINATSVTGAANRGIFAQILNAASTGLSVTATGAVTGGTFGIYARHAGAGGSTITVSGAVNGGQNGIGVNSPGANQITVQTGASVTGGTYGINTTVGAPGSADSVSLYGALNSNSVLGDGDDRLKIAATTTFGGGINVDAGADTDILELAGAGAGAFDLSTIGPAQLFRNFETLAQTSAIWTASGTTVLPFTQTGGTLMGNPTFGGLTIGTGATIAPGNSIGTVTVNGNVVFNAGSIYQVEIDNTPASDLIDATGTATLNGGTVQVTTLSADSSFTNGTVFTILNADGGVTGTFDGLTETSAFLDFGLSYTNTQVLLNLRNLADFSSVTQTPNQQAAASGLEPFSVPTGPDAATIFNALVLLNAEDARRAFDLSSGEVHASSQNVQLSAGDLFSSALKRRAGLGAGAPSGIAVQALSFTPDVPRATFPADVLAADAPRVSQETGVLQGQVQNGPFFGMWASVLGETGDIDGNSNAADLDNDAWGLAGGVDATWRTDAGALTAGLAAGFTTSDAAVSALNSSVDADSYDIGLYAAFDTGRFRLSTAGSYAFQDLTTTRNIAFGGINRTANADYDGSVVSASAEAAYRIPLLAGDTVLSPLASFDYLRAHHESFTETGASALNLSGSSETFSTAESGLGLALEHVFTPTNGKALALQLRGQWKHNFGDTRADQRLALAGAPTTPFTVTGVERDRDSLEIGAGFGLEINDRVSVSGRYEGNFFSGETSHRGQISLVIGLN